MLGLGICFGLIGLNEVNTVVFWLVYVGMCFENGPMMKLIARDFCVPGRSSYG